MTTTATWHFDFVNYPLVEIIADDISKKWVKPACSIARPSCRIPTIGELLRAIYRRT